MKKLFQGIKWKENKPYFMFNNLKSNRLESVPCEGNIDITKTDIKICTGYYDLINRKYIPCKEQTKMDGNYSQCFNCQKLSGFSACLGCHGIECHANSKEALDFCNQSHLVYFAIFGDNKIKVGTTAEYRKDSRILEQGAVFSVFIAKTPNGRTARMIEKFISKQGITQMVNSTYKISHLPIFLSEEEIKIQINELLQKIKNHCTNNLNIYFINPEYNFFNEINDKNIKHLTTDVNQMTLFDESPSLSQIDYLYEINPSEIIGKIVNVIGTILLIENKGKITAVDTKKMDGYVITINQKFELGEESERLSHSR